MSLASPLPETAAGSRRRHGVAPHARGVAITAVLLASLFPMAQPVAAASSVTATGGSAISADSAGAGGSGSWTTLTGPVVAESAAGQVGAGTITLVAPAGFEFNPASGSIGTSGASCAGLSLAALTVTATTASTTVSGASTGACTLTWNGLGVRPLNGTPKASGNITRGGTAAITGVASGTAMGTLTEITGAPAKLAFTLSPTGGTGGTAFAAQPAVAVQDQFGNAATSASAIIAVAITPSSGTSGAVLTCTGGLTKSTTGGASAFAGCAIDLAGNGYNLTASAAGLTSAVTSSFSIAVGTPSRAVFGVPPGGGTGGLAWATQPVVRLLDAGGNPTSATTAVSLAITGGSGTTGAVLTCTGGLSKAAVAGVATFAGCAIDKSGVGYTVTASGSGLTVAVSTPFQVAVGAAAKLVFATQPGGGTAGAAWANQPAVAVADAGGNTVVGATTTITLAVGTNPGAGTLTCTGGLALAAASGVSSFAGCSVDKTGAGYTLTASATGLTGTTSSALAITPAAPTALVIAVQPGGGTGGVAWGTQPSIKVVDAFGNTVTSSTAAISLTLAVGASGAVLGCTGGNTKAAVAGVATFAGCKVDLAGAGYSVTVASAGLTGATSTTFTIAVGAASQLVFITQPGGGTGGSAWASQPTIQVLDAGGNPVTTSSLSVTLSITAGTGTPGATIACTPGLSSSAVAGIVTFAGCRIDKVGVGYTIKASGAGVVAATSNAVATTVGAPAKLAFGTQPGGGTAGAAWNVQPAVLVQDAGGNTVPTATNSVTLAIGAGTAGAALSCTGGLSLASSSGTAGFAGCTVDRSGAGYTLVASSAGLTSSTSATYTIVAGTGVALAVTTQPVGGTGGTAWATQPIIRIVDAWGNTAASTASVTLAITTGTGSAGGALACTGGLSKTAAAGVATFSGCKIDLIGSGYTLTATAPGLAGVDTSAFNVIVGAAALAVFSIQPGGGTGGLAWAAQPAIQLLDAGGNPTTATTSVTLAISAGTGTSGAVLTCPGGLSRAAVAGVATFAGCAIDKAGANYTVKVTGTGLTTLTSAAFTIAVGPGAKLLFTTQPGGGTAGTAWATQPVVAVADTGGNTVAVATDTVTLAIATNPGAGALSCTGGTALGAVTGAAAFAGCTVDRTGTGYTLTATAPGLTSATSSAFNVTPAAAAAIAFSIEPGGGTGGVAWPTQPVVRILDAYGNTVTSATAAVTLTLAGGTSGAVLACTGGNAKAAVAGVATFSGCKVDIAGTGYTVSATASGLTGDTSSSFGVIVGPAAQLAFSVQPGGGTGGTAWAVQPSVAVLDAGGNPVTASALAVTLAITTGTGASGAVMSCTGGPASAAVAGVAAFVGCKIDKAGANYTLKATGTAVTAGTSTAFSVAVGAPAKLAFTTTPTSIVAGAAFGTQPTVGVQDAGGNLATAATDQVTLAITTGTGTAGASLTCTGGVMKSASAGLAAYNGCTVDRVGTGYTLTASAAGLTSAASGGFAVTAGAAAALQFVNQPGGGTGGTVWAAQPSVRIVDAYGNLATGSVTVQLGIAQGTGAPGAALTCTGGQTKVTTASLATFAGCKIDRASTGYGLVANATGLTPGSSAAFDVVPGIGVSMVFSGQPGGGTAMAPWAAQPVVTILDAGGNVSTGASGQIVLAVTAGTAGATLTCLGGLTAMATAGVAAYAGCQLDKAGSGYTISATAAGLPAASSGAFTVVAGAPTHLAFSAQPGGGTGGLAWATQPVVSLQDDGGNTVTTGGLTVTLALTSNPAGGTLSCNGGLSRLTQAGVATFTGCTIDLAGAGFQLTASLSGGGATGALSTLFNVVTGPAARLVFETSPSGGTGGTAWTTQPVVVAADAGGNATTTTPTITIAVEAGSGTTGALMICGSGATRAAVAGRATWTGCAIDKAAAGYQLRATATGLVGGLSSAFDVVAGPASRLGFSAQPSGGSAGVALATQPAVLLLDAGGNPASGATPVTLDFASNPGGGTLSCTGGTTATPVAGVATFTGCWIDRAGSTYQLRAVAAGLTAATSSTFGVVAGAAARLGFIANPIGGTGGTSFPAQPVVRVEDAYGNVATSASVTVTLSLAVNPSGGSLACNGGTAMATAGGLAVFNGCRIDSVGVAYELAATATGLTTALSTPFDIVAGPPARLVFALQPSGGPGGDAWSVQPVVDVRDAGGNPTAATVPVTLALGANPGSGTLACTTGLVLTTVNGTVAFGGCTVDRAASGYTLLATASGLAAAVSATFGVTVGPPAQLGFSVQPSGGAAGSTWTTQPVVAVEDAGGNLVLAASDTINLAPGSGAAGALACDGGTSVQAVNGAAVFSGCSWTLIGGGNVVQAIASGLAPASSAPFTVTVGTPARLRFATPPAGALGGTAFSVQPVVQVTDAWDNPVTSSSVAVTLGVQANLAGGTLACNGGPVRTTSASLATFSSCSIDKAGAAYRVVANSAGLSDAVSPPLDVVPGAASQLAFIVQPGPGMGGSPLGTQPVAALLDAGGNQTTSGSGNVTLALTPGAGTTGAVLACSGGNVSAPSGGLATFDGCTVDRVGSGYTLTASHTGFPSVVSAMFSVTTGPAAALVITTGPGGGTGGVAWDAQPVIRAVDLGGNPVASSAVVTLGLSQNPTGGALTCTGGLSIPAAAGVATYAGCAIDKAGAGYALAATSPGLTTATGASFAIAAGPAARAAFGASPGGGPAAAAFAVQPQVALYDAGGNLSASTSPVTLTIATGTGTAGAILSCPGGTTRSASSGLASFAGCAVDRAGTGYRLQAAGPGLAPAQSAPFDISPPAAVLSLVPSAYEVTYPAAVTLRATFSQQGAAKPVAFQASTDGTTWIPIATVSSNGEGTASYALAPSLNRRYRAVFLGDATLGPGTSNVVVVGVHEVVTLAPTAGTSYKAVRHGSSVSFTASVRPWAAGRPRPPITFTVYKLVSGTWHRVTAKTVQANSYGRAGWRYAFKTTGRWAVTARAAGTSITLSSATSNWSRFSVR